MFSRKTDLPAQKDEGVKLHLELPLGHQGAGNAWYVFMVQRGETLLRSLPITSTASPDTGWDNEGGLWKGQAGVAGQSVLVPGSYPGASLLKREPLSLSSAIRHRWLPLLPIPSVSMQLSAPGTLLLS